MLSSLQLGTLTTDVAKALRETRQGRLDYRLGKDAMVRAAVGKVRALAIVPHEIEGSPYCITLLCLGVQVSIVLFK